MSIKGACFFAPDEFVLLLPRCCFNLSLARGTRLRITISFFGSGPRVCGQNFFNYSELVIMADIKSKVTEIIVDKLGVEEEDVTLDASFTNDLGADSLDTVEMIMEFEKEFDVTIPDEDAEKISTVGVAINYLSEHVG